MRHGRGSQRQSRVSGSRLLDHIHRQHAQGVDAQSIEVGFHSVSSLSFYGFRQTADQL
jgi:hypothetical protein